MTPRNGTQAVDRAARLLAEIARATQPPTCGALSAAASLPGSTTSRLLGALERHRLVRRDDRGRFLPGEMTAAGQARNEAAKARLAAVRAHLDRFLRDYGTSDLPAFLIAVELAWEVRELTGDGTS